MRAIFISTALTLLALSPATAQIAMTGDFKAAKACAALQSIRKGTNPGDVMLEPGRSYSLIAKNKPDATHYLVAIDGAEPRERWVEVGCGETAGQSTPNPPTGAMPVPGPAAEGGATATHVLAISWEPEFCEDHEGKSECQRETEQSFDATHFSLHGLWPQPNGNFYCNGVDRALKEADKRNQWFELPEPDLDPATRDRLAAIMPGVLSGLERHEWIKHGTCFGGEANAYFNRAAGLAEQVNASPLRALFASKIGQSVTSGEIRAAFDDGFGAGAGARVEVHCQNRGDGREISELIISLAGDVRGSAPLGDLIRAAAPVDADCPNGLIAETTR
jgi:ribonuclease T2